jgi:muramoyltetrapeptide carboxypeptidase
LIKPPRLRSGATIGIAAVSGPADEDRLDRGIGRLRALGYRVVEAANIRRRSGFLAGSDAERADGYRALLADRSIDAIFFSRGGYGCSRVLSRLDPAETAANPKIHMGGSDVTPLLAYVSRHARVTTFYGPMVAVQIACGETLDWEEVLAGEPPAACGFRSEDVLAPGSAEGPVVGGCLSLLASLAGTPEAVRAEGSILFWEDVGEEPYRLDRLLTQLERSGTFDGLRGMLIGSVHPPGHESGEAIGAYLRERFAGAKFPVAAGLPAGHLDRTRVIPLGAAAVLDLDRARELSFSEPVVS